MKNKIQNYEPVDMTGKIEEAYLEGDLYWYGWIILGNMQSGVEINLSEPYNSYEEAKLSQMELMFSVDNVDTTDIFAVDTKDEAHTQLLIKKFKYQESKK